MDAGLCPKVSTSIWALSIDGTPVLAVTAQACGRITGSASVFRDEENVELTRL